MVKTETSCLSITCDETITLINCVLGSDNIAKMHVDMKVWSDSPFTAWQALQEAMSSMNIPAIQLRVQNLDEGIRDARWETVEKSSSEGNRI